MDEDDKEAAERASVCFALMISDLARRFSQHVSSGLHCVESMFCKYELPAIIMLYKALCKHLFVRDGCAIAAILKLWSDTLWKVHANFPSQLFRTTECRLSNAFERH